VPAKLFISGHFFLASLISRQRDRLTAAIESGRCPRAKETSYEISLPLVSLKT